MDTESSSSYADVALFIRFPDSEDALSASLGNSTGCESITFTDCPSTSAATRVLAEDWFATAIHGKCPTLTVMRVMVDSELDIPNEWQVSGCALEGKPWLLITLESTVKDQKAVFWKSADCKEFSKLDMAHDDDVATVVKSFTLDFITESLRSALSVSSIDKSEINLASLIDSSGSNLLMSAVKRGDCQIVCELLKLPFDVNMSIAVDECETWKLIDFAWTANNDDIVLELLRADSVYPKDFSEQRAPEAIRSFLAVSEDLHYAIKKQNAREIADILDANRGQRYFFSGSNVSAVHAALKTKSIAVYRLLVERSLTFGPDEPITGEYKHAFGSDISELNSHQATPIPDREIMQLLAKSVVAHSDPDARQRLRDIRESFEALIRIPEIRPILQAAAADKRVKLHFDFTQDSVRYMNPAARQASRGLFNARNHHIFVAARGLLDERTKHETRGIIVHEMDHCCLQNVFHNERLPYGASDAANKARFEQALADSKFLMEEERLVELVFESYDESAHGRELAVRVPQMLAHYSGNSERVESLKKIFKLLFGYFYEVVLPATRAAIAVLEILADASAAVTFERLTEPLRAAVARSPTDFQGQRVCLKDIVDARVLKTLTSAQIRGALDGAVLSIGRSPTEAGTFYIDRGFADTHSMLAFEDAVERVRGTRFLLLSDHAGAGKTTAMRHWSVQLKALQPTEWVTFVDLKEHLAVFKRAEPRFGSLPEVTGRSGKEDKARVKREVLSVLIELIKPADDLERATFTKLFNAGSVTLFFDGVDEIAPKHEQFFTRLIRSVNRLTRSKQWIASRPLHADALREEITLLSRLLPFSSTQNREFIERTFESLSERGAAHMTADAIEAICEKLKFVENPLILRLLIELDLAGKLSLTALNRFSIYEQIIELKQDVLAEEKGAVSNRDSNVDSRVSLWEVHQIYALLLIFGGARFTNHINDNCVELGELQLFQLWDKDKCKWTPIKISRCGLLVISGWCGEDETPCFTHRTFAEYFVARFLIDNIGDALEARNDELTAKEFNTRMKLAISLLVSLCERSTENVSVIGEFIADHLSLQGSRKFEFGPKFLAFTRRCELRNFVERRLNDRKNEASTGRFAVMIFNLIKLFGFDESVYKSIMIFNIRQSSLYREREASLTEIADAGLDLYEDFSELTGGERELKIREFKIACHFFHFITDVLVPKECVREFIKRYSRMITFFVIKNVKAFRIDHSCTFMNCAEECGYHDEL